MTPWNRFLLLERHLLIFAAVLFSLQAAASAQTPPNPPGTIAYFENIKILHLVESDGSNDRVIWTNPNANDTFGSRFPAWRPDGQEIAFASGHEVLRSLHLAEIYGIRPDGTGLRRITNSPLHADLASYAKGSVQIEVRNEIADWANFFLYVVGADEAFQFVMNPGFQGTVTIANVADFGDGVRQDLIVYDAWHDWYFVGIPVDVVAGQTVAHAGMLTLGNNHISAYKSNKPSWKRDGTQLAYDLGNGPLWVVSVDPPLLDRGTSLFPEGTNIFVRSFAWSPVSDAIAYSTTDGIFSVTPGINVPDTLVNLNFNLIEGISWLPDGSGFIYSILGPFNAFADLYLYNFSPPSITNLTNFTDELALRPSVSPDGQFVSYTYSTGGDSATFDVRIMKLDGTNSWKIADNGDFSAWGPAGDITPPPPGGGSGLMHFNPQNSQQNVFQDGNIQFVHGPNSYEDVAKATAFTLPNGQTEGQLTDVRVWFGFKRDGLTSETYEIEIYNGDASSGPTGAAIASQSYLMANINADADLTTPENATVHTLSSPVTVGQTFFVAVNFGNYSQENHNAVAILATEAQGQRVAEDWELWSDGTWITISDAWIGDGSPNSGMDGWYMWIEAVVKSITSVQEEVVIAGPATRFELMQNYPNPFNPETEIHFVLPKSGQIDLKIFDALGREIRHLAHGNYEMGAHVIRWDGKDDLGHIVASGIYHYQLRLEDRQQIKKMLLLR